MTESKNEESTYVCDTFTHQQRKQTRSFPVEFQLGNWVFLERKRDKKAESKRRERWQKSVQQMQKDWEAIGGPDNAEDQLVKSSYGELFLSLRDVHRQPFAIDIMRLNCGQFTRSAANIQRLDTLLTSAKYWTTLQARTQFEHFQKQETERMIVAKQKAVERLALFKKSLTESR